MAMAGQRYRFTPKKLLRAIGMFLHYSYYIQRRAFDNDRFSEPPEPLSDPTEKGQFSNLAGKAIADFLSKRIDKSIFTANYEAAMRVKKIKLKGPRPDLIAYSKTSTFAIEVKGRAQSNPGDMAEHKKQALSGKIKVNFSVACISYNLFNRVQCNYHDPYNENIPFDIEGLRETSKMYYSGLSEFLNIDYFSFEEIQYNNESFYEVDLSHRTLRKFFRDEFPTPLFVFLQLIDAYRPKLIIPGNIADLAKNGLRSDTEPFLMTGEDIKANTYADVYIDTDRVGLRIDGF
jgi:hypothetical protein